MSVYSGGEVREALKSLGFQRSCAERRQEAWVLGFLWASHTKVGHFSSESGFWHYGRKGSDIRHFKSFGSSFRHMPLLLSSAKIAKNVSMSLVT